ncbi:MAG: redox-sensing transcriptional repressor Rex [Oscillospiraceae bacterium]
MTKHKVSTAVIRRLPRYFRHLNDLLQGGVVRISSNALGDAMGLTASQIRQDLSCFGEFGQQGYGYHVETLLAEVSDILGINNGHNAIIVGAGNLGRALIENFHFDSTGFRLTAAFDINPTLVGTRLAGIPVLHTDKLEQYIAEHPTHVAVLTIPGGVARETATRLVDTGIRGLWNFTNVELELQNKTVVVENVHFADSLLALNYMISE